MRARTLTTTFAGTALALVLVPGLAACSSSTTSTPAASSSAAVAASAGTSASDPASLCAQIVDQKLTLEAANALAEANGSTTRVIKKDGEDLPATTDLNETRLNFAVDADVVTACTVG